MKKLISISIFVLGVIFLRLKDASNWSWGIGMLLMLFGAALFRKAFFLYPPIVKSKKITFLETLTPLKECKKAYYISVIGLALPFALLGAFAIWEVDVGWYFRNNHGLAFVLLLVFGGVFGYLLKAYVTCVVEHGRKNNLF